MPSEPLAMPALPPLRARPLTEQDFAPYGWVLGLPFPGGTPVASFGHALSDFWQAQLFDTGVGGETEVLWVAYRNREPGIEGLEQHLLTQQAIIPLTGEIVQFVACGAPEGGPDPATLAAFAVPPGMGICMRADCWHATRVTSSEVRCAMLTRRSTTLDLVRHLRGAAAATESAFASIPRRKWVAV